MTQRHFNKALVGAASALGLAAAFNAGAAEMSFGDTDLSIYGMARGVASYSMDEDTDGDGGEATYNMTTSGEEGSTGHFDADANTSRFGFIAELPNDVTTQIEGDFYGDGFRLRHAYGEYNNVLAGQYWSNFTSFAGFTPTVDFNGSTGLAGTQGRNAQLRYTMGRLSVALEDIDNSIDTLDDGDVVASGDEKQELPALTAKFADSVGNFDYAVAGLVDRLEVDGADGDDTTTGFAMFVDGGLDITDTVSVQGTFSYSDGATSPGLYLADFYNGGAPDGYIQDGNIEKIEGMGGSLGVSMDAGPGAVNLAYGFTDVDVDDAVDSGAATDAIHEMRDSLHLNYIWNPTESVTYGVEAARLSADEQSGADNSATQLNFLAQYNF